MTTKAITPRAQALRGHAAGPHPRLQAICSISEAIPGYSQP
jgi:hypothetical protein